MGGELFVACGLRDWLAMAMIAGAGAALVLVLLALLLLVCVKIAARMKALWPDVM